MRKPFSKKGLSLIEIVISLAILLPSLLVCIFVLTNAQHMSQEARNRLLALNTARSVIETIKDTPLQNITAINTAGLIPAELRNGAVVIATNPANLINAQIATVTVTVTWTGVKNMPRAFRITTMRSRY